MDFENESILQRQLERKGLKLFFFLLFGFNKPLKNGVCMGQFIDKEIKESKDNLLQRIKEARNEIEPFFLLRGTVAKEEGGRIEHQYFFERDVDLNNKSICEAKDAIIDAILKEVMKEEDK